MNFKILLFTILSIFAFSSCTAPQKVLLTSRSSSFIDSIQIMRPLAIMDWLDVSETDEDSSNQISVAMEENIMDAVEIVMPKRIGISYLKPPSSEFPLIDSCLNLVRNKILASGELSVSIPKPLREIMAREGVSHLLYIQAEGYQRSRRNYKNEKNEALIGTLLDAIVGNDATSTEIPTQGKLNITAFIIDKERSDVAFFNEMDVKAKSVISIESVQKIITKLFDGYFYKYKKGVIEDIKK